MDINIIQALLMAACNLFTTFGVCYCTWIVLDEIRKINKRLDEMKVK